MVDEIVFAAISRRDGSPGDGVHLIWSPPQSSGYSVGGFDIHRRQAQRTRLRCHALTAAELAQLHAQFEVTIPMARVGVRRSACPAGLSPAPGGPQGGQSRVIDFAGLPIGRNPNPIEREGVVFRVLDRTGAPARVVEIVPEGRRQGLRIAHGLEIRLPPGTVAARVLLREADTDATVEATAADGTVVRPSGRGRTPDGRLIVHIEGPALERISIQPPADGAVLTGLDLDLDAPAPRTAGPVSLTARGPPPSGMTAIATTPVCLCYEVDFNTRQRLVQVTIRIGAALAIATRAGKAVATRLLTNPAGVQTATFSEAAVDQVLLYVTGAASGLTVCADTALSPEEEAAEWRDAKLIAEGVDFPLTALDPSLGGPAGELALAKSRLLSDESLDELQFEDVAELLNEVAATAARQPPVLLSLVEREQAADPFVETRPWPHALSLTLDPVWRRVLGCGHLDPASDLTPGEAYDYRITGRFRRRDAEERVFGLHDLPIGTALPPAFHLGPVLFRPPEGAVVDFGPSSSEAPLRRLGRKGVRLTGSGVLTIAFDQPVTRLALEIDPEAGQTLSYEARPSEFILGLSNTAFAAPLPTQPRVEIVFPEPVDRLRLKGAGFFVGVRLLDHPAGTAADEIVTRTAYVLGVRFEATAPPPEPLLVETDNLQQPLTGGDPAEATGQGLKEIGFRVRWAPPEEGNAGPTPLPWPGDATSPPPTMAAGFHIERRRVDTGEPFHDVDDEATLFVGARAPPGAPATLRTGADLAALYGGGLALAAPDRRMDIEDVLVRADVIRAPPGSLHQYRVFTLDAIGRRSLSARLGPQVRLEKHRPPPQPVGPTGDRPPFAPVGVRARLLQSSDPELLDDDRALLGDSTNAIVVEWGWTEPQRAHDPFAREFRVYFHATPPDVVGGVFSGVAVANGGGFAMQATLDQPVAPDAMKGAYLNAGGYPFKVAAHGPGEAVTLQLDAAILEPGAVPAAGAFQFLSALDGAELRPTRWDERLAVVPITAEADYRFIIRDAVQLTPETPRVRVWVGVATADGEAYIADERDAASPNGGRPGNESSVTAVAVSGRYLGRPDYTPPPPLAVVPELVTSEPGGATVQTTLDLDALLAAIPVPTGHRVALERVAVNDLAPLLSVGTDDLIGVTFPKGGSTRYALANPDDQSAFLAQIRSSNPALVEGRFLLDLLHRFPAELAGLWQGLGAPIAPSGRFPDTLPAKPERYFHRIRIADAADRLSLSGAILPQVVRTPSLRAPGAPEVTLADSATDVLDIGVRVRAAYDLAHVAVFALVSEQALDAATLATSLVRLPNRRDLPPADGLRLRLDTGAILPPVLLVDVATAVIEPPDALLTIPLGVPRDRHVAVWCVSLTRDRIPSPPSGPHLARSGPPALVVPALAVTRSGAVDTAQWPSPAAGVQASLERSVDGGASWAKASPWLPSTVGEWSTPTPPVARLYRLALRGPRGAPVFGPAVEPGP